MKSIRYLEVTKRDKYQGQSRRENPPERDQDVVLLQVRQQIAPTGIRLAKSESKEGQRNLRDHVLRHQQCGLGQHDPVGMWQDVTAQDVKVRSSESATGNPVFSSLS